MRHNSGRSKLPAIGLILLGIQGLVLQPYLRTLLDTDLPRAAVFFATLIGLVWILIRVDKQANSHIPVPWKRIAVVSACVGLIVIGRGVVLGAHHGPWGRLTMGVTFAVFGGYAWYAWKRARQAPSSWK